MAELLAAGTAIGVASSLLTFGDVAWRVLNRLKEYCNRTKNVPNVIKQVIKHIIPQLEILAQKLEESEKIRQAENDKLTAKMLPMKDDSKRVRAKKAVLSVYYEKEMSKIWGELEQYKTTFLVQHTNMASQSGFILEEKTPKTHYHYPASAVSRRVTREMLLGQIEDAFSQTHATANPRVLVLLGLGGCSKTQLALQYCQDSEEKRRFSSIFWVDASFPTAVAHSFVKIANIITDNKADLHDTEAGITTVKGRLSTWTDRWLLVFDNFDNPKAFEGKDIRNYFPHGKSGAILFTSRNGEAKRLGHDIHVDEMLQSEGLELLFLQAGCERDEPNSMIGKEVIARLGNLALAIDQAGAYISARGLPLHLFIDHYDKRREKVLKEIHATLWEYTRKLRGAERETSLSVFTTWEMSSEQIDTKTVIGKTEEHLITLSAFFDRNDVFEDLFKIHFESETPEWMRSLSSEGAWDSFEFQDLVVQLANLSLISSLQVAAAGANFSLHPLVQDWIKLRLGREERRRKTAEAISIIGHFIENQDALEMPLGLTQTLLLHMTAHVQNEAAFLDLENGFESPVLMYAAHNFANFYRRQGRLNEAKDIYSRVLAGKAKALGPDHYSTLRTLNNLANLYRDQGRLVEAEAMFCRALAGAEKALEPYHPLTLDILNNLAILYSVQGRLTDAEAMYDCVLARKEEALGPDHASTLDTVNNLAVLYKDLGRLAVAEAMYDRALAAKEKALGPDHSSTLETLNNLAVIYMNQGRLAEAEPMFDRALAGKEKVLGPDHASTVRTITNLADLYKAQGRLADAESILTRLQLGS